MLRILNKHFSDFHVHYIVRLITLSEIYAYRILAIRRPSAESELIPLLEALSFEKDPVELTNTRKKASLPPLHAPVLHLFFQPGKVRY